MSQPQRERRGEGDREAAEEHPHDRHRQQRDERREPDRLPDVRVDDVALELPDDDKREQREQGDVQRLREADGEDENRADHGTAHRLDFSRAVPRFDAGASAVSRSMVELRSETG